MSVEATVLPAAMLGISGLVVLAAGEYGGELELLVETSESVTVSRVRLCGRAVM